MPRHHLPGHLARLRPAPPPCGRQALLFFNGSPPASYSLLCLTASSSSSMSNPHSCKRASVVLLTWAVATSKGHSMPSMSYSQPAQQRHQRFMLLKIPMQLPMIAMTGLMYRGRLRRLYAALCLIACSSPASMQAIMTPISHGQVNGLNLHCLLSLCRLLSHAWTCRWASSSIGGPQQLTCLYQERCSSRQSGTAVACRQPDPCLGVSQRQETHLLQVSLAQVRQIHIGCISAVHERHHFSCSGACDKWQSGWTQIIAEPMKAGSHLMPAGSWCSTSCDARDAGQHLVACKHSLSVSLKQPLQAVATDQHTEDLPSLEGLSFFAAKLGSNVAVQRQSGVTLEIQ